ncbi:LuxR C-terminal-related transcriptional regulator [Noviherbaspirillum saxi]|uniref:ATP-dependent transcriptional regulator n=1 Tax=Noviherbaspirillum saxi TaxID=2320863 RepID=A0A3A3FRR7_9BURK|nr:LuxR C-terminal-related transcriptional regulator [Noviherbaspirillum saxi]RJF98533.1 ATP-dependent transcriptional regulator [Noviherbaspirillum saxi]
MNFDKLLVATKFAPPRIGTRYIPRKQLLHHLRNTQHCTVALVSASAGFGKTILLVQWRQELMKSGAEVAWLSLSHEDKQLRGFCSYLLAAFQRMGIQIEEDMLQESSSGKSLDAVVAVVASEAEKIAKELYLIIDDYHYVEDPWAHRLMQKLLDHCPANLHFLIASRVSPPLSLRRLRLVDQVAEIGFTELPFDLDETRVFFEQNLSAVKLTADELRLIHDMTIGWPASLQLIAIMLRNRPQTREKLHSFLWRSTDLQAYLAEDVVAHLPSELTAFMESVSVCRRFNAELAAFITENDRAAELLKRAEDESLLIYRIESDDRSPWYRFHPLFGEFLASRLAHRGQGTVEALHRRASQWFAEHDFLVESVRHANLGGDLDFAVKAIEHAAPANWSLSYISPMLHLLDRLPQETLFAHPKLFFLGCLTYALTAHPGEAEQWLEKVRRSDAAKNPAISSKLALADATIALQRDDSKRAIDLLEPTYYNVSLDNRFLRYVYLSALAAAYLAAGRLSDSRRLLDDNPVPPEDRDTDVALIVESSRAGIFLIEGNVKEAARVGATILARAETACGRGSVPANLCATTLSDAYYELDRIDDAREVLANRTGVLRSSMPDVMARASLCHARLDMLQETPDVAVEFLQTQVAHFHSLGLDRPLAYMHAEQVKILLAKGDHVRATELVTKLNALGVTHRDAAGYRAEIPIIAALARSRLALANCNPGEALNTLEEVHRFAEKLGRARMLVMANLLAAIALADLKRHDEAAACLIQAVQSGATLGLVRTFLDEGERVSELLATLANNAALVATLDAPTAQYLDSMLGRFGRISPSAQGARKSNQGNASAQATLTPRELEILGLVSQAMSSKRIGLTLNITADTVNWNIRNILAKLGVSSRYDAMTWARRQGLIE